MAYYYTLDNEYYFLRWSVGAAFEGCSKLPDGVDVPEALQTCSCNVRAYKYINREIIYDPERADVSDLYEPAVGGGAAGKDGKDGKDGISCAHSWSGTTLTVTSASGTSSADLKGEKGEKGDKGDTGERGEKGDTGGVTSFNGRTGAIVPTTGDYTAEMVGAMTKMGYVTNFSKNTGNLSVAGWYRFARVNWGGACTLWFNMRNDYYSGGPCSLTAIAVLDAYAPSFSALNYAHTSSYTPWTKIRIVKDASGYICLDGYYGSGTKNSHVFTGFCMGVSYHITSEDIAAVGETASGETVLLTQAIS